MSPSAIVQNLRNYCNVLRDDLSACDAQAGGMSYGDYVEQLTLVPYHKGKGNIPIPRCIGIIFPLFCADISNTASIFTTQ
jgi:hypothetical protein